MTSLSSQGTQGDQLGRKMVVTDVAVTIFYPDGHAEFSTHENPNDIRSLTFVQLDRLRLLAQGRSMKEVAEIHRVTVKRTQVMLSTYIYPALDSPHTYAGAIVRAYQLGVLSDAELGPVGLDAPEEFRRPPEY